MKKLYVLVLLFACIGVGVHAQDITSKLDKYLSGPGVFNGTALVMHKGQVVLYKGYGYKNKDAGTMNDSLSICRIGSTNKPFTATVIMKLEEQGLLKLSNVLSRYLVDYPGGDSITLEQLLTHRSGYELYGSACVFHPGGVPGFVTDFRFWPEEDLCVVLLNNCAVGKADGNRVAAMVLGRKWERREL